MSQFDRDVAPLKMTAKVIFKGSVTHLGRMIRLIVGDRTFTASTQTLNKADYFRSLLLRWDPKESEMTLDDDPKLFRHFLNSLRYDGYEIPAKHQNNVYRLLDFYGVKYNKTPVLYRFRNKGLSQPKDKIVFTGKLQGIHFYNKDNFELEISFNDQTIFNRAITRSFYFDGEVRSASNDSPCNLDMTAVGRVFNMNLIPDLESLEGNFKIGVEMEKLSEHSVVEVSYFERV